MTEDSKLIYETIGKLANPPINVLFDPDYTPRRLTIRLQKVTLPEALDIVALQSRTFWRPVTSNTIFVAQDTQAKRRELEQNVVKTFYLGNVSGPTDLQDIVNAIRTVLEVQRIQQIPSQSAIVIKGTPDQLALAQKMIDDIDKSKPEVIVDVVVAQVRRDKNRQLGNHASAKSQRGIAGSEYHHHRERHQWHHRKFHRRPELQRSPASELDQLLSDHLPAYSGSPIF